MTVQELRDWLFKFPSTSEIFIYNVTGGGYTGIHSLEIEMDEAHDVIININEEE